VDGQQTITEALAEIKTIDKRLVAKRDEVTKVVVRDARVVDPKGSEGGSEAYVTQVMQSITDLEARWVSLRAAIQKANCENVMIIQGQARTVSEWLAWRREVAEGQVRFRKHLASGIAQFRASTVQFRRQGTAEVDEQPIQAIVNLNETELAEQLDALELILGKLDGQLSLFNARCMV
jgi:hypothetical protein